MRASHSTRVRGLKYKALGTLDGPIQSHSTRVRGLKYPHQSRFDRSPLVALYTSAWIEITHPLQFTLQYLRRTLHECVD